ncbi:MAG: FAD-dependent oxidoreductase [Actinobacteria bacterium]|nr:MAG: FAD-dependent oxidoreductase [Actinomycetota bacterium]
MPQVVVVGGGIIGAACADELTRRSASVTLLERDELASGASGRNQGLWVPPEDPALHAIASRSLARYLEIADDAPLPFRIDPHPVGTVFVAVDEEDLAEATDTLATVSAWGFAVSELDDAALVEAEPEVARDLAAAWFIDAGHRLDPAALTVTLALLAASRGAVIRHHLSARALVTDGDHVTGVVTDEGEIKADEVVVAAGPWSPRLLEPLGIRLPVLGVRGWLVRVDPREPLLRHLVRTAEGNGTVASSLAGDIARSGFPTSDGYGSIVHPHPDGTALIGSSRAAWLTPEPEDPSVPRQLLTNAIRIVPRLADAVMLSSWWGLRPMTPDERPVIGRVRDGLVVATGHGSEGVINGAGTAELVASVVLGERPPFDASLFDPFRFA